MDSLTHPYTIFLLRLLVGGVFIVSGVSKMANQTNLISAVASYQILPAGLIRPFARLLPPVEIIVGGGLLVGLLTRVVATLAVLLLTMFLLAIGGNLLRKNEIDCYCFGPLYQEKISVKTLGRVAALLLSSTLIASMPSQFIAVDTWLVGPAAATENLSPLGVLPYLLLLVLLVLFVALLWQVFANMKLLGREAHQLSERGES